MLDLDLAKRFTWLLRTDVRKGKKSSDTPDEAFMQWWLVQGRAECTHLQRVAYCLSELLAIGRAFF